MTSKQKEIALEAWNRVHASGKTTNFAAIYYGFLAKGIPASEIKPRENIFTYHAWRHAGRQVKRGEHGVRVVTVIEPEDGTKRLWNSTVFHISQTEPIAEGAAHA